MPTLSVCMSVWTECVFISVNIRRMPSNYIRFKHNMKCFILKMIRIGFMIWYRGTQKNPDYIIIYGWYCFKCILTHLYYTKQNANIFHVHKTVFPLGIGKNIFNNLLMGLLKKIQMHYRLLVDIAGGHLQ